MKMSLLLWGCFLILLPAQSQAELIDHLPKRCRHLASKQHISSPAFLRTQQKLQRQRRLKTCRTQARKRYMQSDTTTRVAAQKLLGTKRTLPSEIVVQENELLELHAGAATGAAENAYWHLWTFRYNNKVFFSSEPVLRVRFPDNGHTLVRLWTRHRASKKVSKQLIRVSIKNTAPSASLLMPKEAHRGETVTIQAHTNDPSITDRAHGFRYLWNITDQNEIQEDVSGILTQQFNTTGEKLVSLQVSDKDGASSFLQQTIKIHPQEVSLSNESTTLPTKTVTSTKAIDAVQEEKSLIHNSDTSIADAQTTSVRTHTLKPTPEIQLWEHQMREYGAKHCAVLKSSQSSADQRLGSTYYDAQWVYYQIADYTKERQWIECAEYAERAYRDSYVSEWQGRVPGYWNFTHGLLEDVQRTGDPKSKAAVLQIAQSAAFAGAQTPLAWTVDATLSREVAYTIMSYLNAAQLGAAPNPRLPLLVDQAYGHLEQWFETRTASYMRPFMVALTAQALIEYDAYIGSEKALEKIKGALEDVWQTTWIPEQQTFQYTDREHESGGTEPAHDLNLLIAPAYAWVYHKTGDVSFLDKADAAFSGGVKNAWLENPKQFNQNYRWSFAYLRWRSTPPLQ